jgi:hypothetical protein
MLYVYAILEGGGGGVSGNGLQNQPLECEAFDGLSLVFSRHTANPTPSAENLWRHERVVESLMRTHTLLPSRFATTVRDEAALAERIAPHAAELKAGLERVRGCVELGLRVLWPQEQAAISANAHATGRGYMLARLAEERRRKAMEEEAGPLFDRVHNDLAPLARESTRSMSSSARPVLTAAYLVELDNIERFRNRVREVRGSDAKFRVLCTGPWPPYNFVPALRAAPEAAEVRHG